MGLLGDSLSKTISRLSRAVTSAWPSYSAGITLSASARTYRKRTGSLPKFKKLDPQHNSLIKTLYAWGYVPPSQAVKYGEDKSITLDDLRRQFVMQNGGGGKKRQRAGGEGRSQIADGSYPTYSVDFSGMQPYSPSDQFKTAVSSYYKPSEEYQEAMRNPYLSMKPYEEKFGQLLNRYAQRGILNSTITQNALKELGQALAERAQELRTSTLNLLEQAKQLSSSDQWRRALALEQLTKSGLENWNLARLRQEEIKLEAKGLSERAREFEKQLAERSREFESTMDWRYWQTLKDWEERQRMLDKQLEEQQREFDRQLEEKKREFDSRVQLDVASLWQQALGQSYGSYRQGAAAWESELYNRWLQSWQRPYTLWHTMYAGRFGVPTTVTTQSGGSGLFENVLGIGLGTLASEGAKALAASWF